MLPTLLFWLYSHAPQVRWLVGLCPLGQSLRDKIVQEGERGVNFKVLAGSVQWQHRLHHLKVLSELDQLTAALWGENPIN